MRNKLYFGDNLEICRQHIADESVDLIYLDPPFNSQAQYNLLFKTPKNEAAGAQATAFHDTWTWTDETNLAYADLMRGGDPAARIIEALHSALGDSDVMAYLVMMAIRLVELHAKLRPAGSLYLHCDPTASHHFKIILDSVFGGDKFRNEIVWKRTSSHSGARKYAPVRDVLLFYTKPRNLPGTSRVRITSRSTWTSTTNTTMGTAASTGAPIFARPGCETGSPGNLGAA